MINTQNRESLTQSYVRKAHNEVVCIGLLGSLFDLLFGHVKSAVSDVLCDGGGEENRLLTHHAEHLSQVADVKRTDVVPVNSHLKNRIQTHI